MSVAAMLIVFGAKYLIALSVALSLGYVVFAQRAVRRRMVLVAAFALPLAYAVAKTASFFYYNARPFVVENSTPLVAHVADNGFPSDHTLLATALASVVLVYSRTWGALLWLLALCIGVSRVLADVHHVVDIAASAAIAAAVVSGVYVLVRTKQWYAR